MITFSKFKMTSRPVGVPAHMIPPPDRSYLMRRSVDYMSWSHLQTGLYKSGALVALLTPIRNITTAHQLGVVPSFDNVNHVVQNDTLSLFQGAPVS